MKRSPIPPPINFPKSKSAHCRLASPHPLPSGQAESSEESKDIFDISSQKLKMKTAAKPRPKTLPKPAYVVLDRENKTVTLSPEYAEYDVNFSSRNPHPNFSENGPAKVPNVTTELEKEEDCVYCSLDSPIDSKESFENGAETAVACDEGIAALSDVPKERQSQDSSSTVKEEPGRISPDRKEYAKMAEEIYEEEEERVRECTHDTLPS